MVKYIKTVRQLAAVCPAFMCAPINNYTTSSTVGTPSKCSRSAVEHTPKQSITAKRTGIQQKECHEDSPCDFCAELHRIAADSLLIFCCVSPRHPPRRKSKWIQFLIGMMVSNLPNALAAPSLLIATPICRGLACSGCLWS